MIGVAMHGGIFLFESAMLVIPISIDVPGADAHDILRHGRVGEAAIEVTDLALIDIGIVIRAETAYLVLITSAHDGLDRLLLRIAVIIAAVTSPAASPRSPSV